MTLLNLILAFFLSLLPHPPQQARIPGPGGTSTGGSNSIAFVSSATPTSLSSTQASITVTKTIAGGDNIMLSLTNFSNQVSGITISDSTSANTYVVLANYNNIGIGGGNNNLVIACAHGMTGGTNVVITFTATGLDFPTLSADEYSGTMACTADNFTASATVSSTAGLAQATGTTGGTAVSATYTTTNANDLLYTLFYTDNAAATWSTLQSGWVPRTNTLGFTFTADRIVSATQSSQTISATSTNADESLLMVAVH